MDSIVNTRLSVAMSQSEQTDQVDAVVRKKKTIFVKQNVCIPEISEHADFIKSEHKLNELKEICKHYGIKCSGTKPELKTRIHNHLIQ